MQHRDKIIIQKVISEIELGLDMLGEATIDEFTVDEKLKRAVTMTVINIGELVKNISREMREANPSVPWKAIAGMRDIAAHRYQTLRVEDVYFTLVNDFPTLKGQLQSILNGEGKQ